MTPNPRIADRDALMRHDAQWKHLATPGHVLLARVTAYRHKSLQAYYVLVAAVLVGLLSLWLPQRVGALFGWPIGKIASLFDRHPEPPTRSPAPALRPFAANLAQTFNEPTLLPSPQVINGALIAAAANIRTGKGIEGCDTASKITDAWSTSDSAVPHCRYSSDKSRLWVWGADGANGSYTPFLSLIRKDEQGAVKVFNVAGFAPVGGYPQIRPADLFPRAVAADFPELKG